jgi:hypothetical protein
MSYAGSVHTDDIRRPASLLEAQRASRLHRSMSAPTLLLLDMGVTETTTAAQQSAQQHQPMSILQAAESQPEDIPLLGPVPVNFHGAYDYLGKVESLAEAIEPGLFNTLFEQRFPPKQGSVYCICRADRTGQIRKKGAVSWKPWIEAEELRRRAIDADEQDPSILIAESIDKAETQLLGMLFDVNPSFFAQHLRCVPNGPDDPLHKQIIELRESFPRSVSPRDRSQFHSGDPGETSSHTAATTHLDAYHFADRDRKGNPQDNGSSRWKVDRWGRVHLRPRISCYQVSKCFCKNCSALVLVCY